MPSVPLRRMLQPGSPAERFLQLRPRGVVLHPGGVGIRIHRHAAVAPHQRQAPAGGRGHGARGGLADGADVIDQKRHDARFSGGLPHQAIDVDLLGHAAW